MLTTPTRAVAAPAPSQPRRTPLRVVTERELRAVRARSRTRRVAAIACALVVLGLFGVVVAHVLLMQGQFELQHLQEQRASSEAEYDRLRLQVSELESPDRVVAVAHQKLGMVTPARITYLAPTPEALSLSNPVPSPSGSARKAEDTAEGAVAVLPDAWSSVKSQLADG